MDYWESGMDMKVGNDIYDSFRAYQGKLLREYHALADEHGFRVIDGRRPIDAIQEELRRQIAPLLTTDNGDSSATGADTA
jgi:dTMP kinase